MKIRSFGIVTLRTVGMRHAAEYEIVMKGDEAEVSRYAMFFGETEDRRRLERRALCSQKQILKLLNACRLLKWDGFYGERPKGLRDGTTFHLNAVVNDGREICARGAQNFPRGYAVFMDALNEILRAPSAEKTVSPD
ncbi:MAG: hypothetical protein KIG36_04120 [Eubacteriales bacterium]|nr:hypothetical protein [Eubacteriales bacterium]